MDIFQQLGWIFLFGLGGQALERIIPLAFPASALGLLLMLAALRLGWLKPARLGRAADFISANMAFFFLPSAVAILGDFSAVRHVLLPVLAVVAVSTLFVFAVTYAVAAGCQRLMAKGR